MSNVLIDPCSIDIGDLIAIVWQCSGYGKPLYSSITSNVFINNTIENANIIYRGIYNAGVSGGSFQNQTYDKVEAVYTPTASRRICLVRVPVKLVNHSAESTSTGYEVLHYLPVSNVSDIGNDFNYSPFHRVANATRGIADMSGWSNYQLTTSESPYGALSLVSFNPSNIDAFDSFNKVTNSDNVANLKAIANGKNYYFAYTQDGDTRYGGGLNIIPSYMYGGCYAYEKLPDSIPVFDVEQVNEIRAFLDSGDDSGRKDPFDPNNPSIKTVTNFKTDFKTYVTRSGKDVTLKTIAYNSQYIAMGDERDDEYGVYCFKRSAGSDGQYGAWSYVAKATQISYPTINIKPIFNTGAPYLELFYGFAKVGDDTRTYGFSIRLESDSAKEYGFKIKEVHCYGDFWHSSTYTGTTRTSITDGYQYTQQADNKYMQVLFRAVTLDDLHDTADDGYDDKSDTEYTGTGTTASEVCGHGLGTYKVSQAGFDAINDALWATDWTQLFKSNTIDPVKCVISCKGIPFAHSGTATDAVYVANQRIGCSAGKCNPVNTYNIGSYTIQAINNNFTDMTMTKVRVYLPYIGWVELPSDEVISRVGRAEVGLTSVTKLLNFKYIVDFVDGSCRCVISVNGTERWYFDGNCGIDIPVTSDNHTSAINNAIKSGVATVMNVGLAVGSAYAGNAMGVASGVTSAIGSLANTIPTYNYSATANSSGYINHSMGNKIIIVIESPNIQMPNGYGHKYGFPCMRNLTLGSLSGYTKCESVDLTGINGTNYELNYIKSALESGVYL